MIDMRKVLLLAALSVALGTACSGIALAAKVVVLPISTLQITIDGSTGVTPKALSKGEYAPVAFTVAASVHTSNPNEPPPPLKEVLIDVANVAIGTKGYPTCTGGSRDIRRADLGKVCADSIVGSGTVGIATEFPGQAPIPATSPLLVLNGGTSGGTTTLYIRAYLTQPIVTAVVTTVKIKKSGDGLKAVASIPKIANGEASVTDLKLKIDKKFTYKGKKHSVLNAKCVGGKIQAHVVAEFYNGSQLQADVLRTCTVKSSEL